MVWNPKNSRPIYIFVKIANQGKDEFYVLGLQDLQGIVFKNHSEFLQKHGGKRPRSPKSMHIAISLKHLSSYRNNWKLLDEEKLGRGRE